MGSTGQDCRLCRGTAANHLEKQQNFPNLGKNHAHISIRHRSEGSGSREREVAGNEWDARTVEPGFRTRLGGDEQISIFRRKQELMNTQPDPLPAQIRCLGTDALAALVVDIWAARGFETDRRGSTVVARGEGTRRIEVSGADSRLPVAGGSIDVTVALDGAGGIGTEVIDAEDLAQLIRYGLSVEQRDSICKRHLGAPPAALTVPWQVRLDAGLSKIAHPAVYVVGVLLCVLVVASVVGWQHLGSIGSTGAPDESAGAPRPGGPGGTDSSTAETQSASGQLTGDTVGESTGSNLPPGVGPGGVVDVSALDAAHDRAIGNRSYRLQVDLYWPRSGQPGAERVHRDMDFRVASDGRYLLHTTVRPLNDSAQGDRPDLRVYHDGRDWFVAESTDDGVEYRWVSGSQDPPIAVPEPTVLRERLASSYLSTPDRNLTITTRETGPEYRLIGRGQPLGASQGITNYSVRALVRSDGLVKELRTRSTRRVTPPVDQRFEMTYDRFDTTTVATPSWVAAEFDLNHPR